MLEKCWRNERNMREICARDRREERKRREKCRKERGGERKI